MWPFIVVFGSPLVTDMLDFAHRPKEVDIGVAILGK